MICILYHVAVFMELIIDKSGLSIQAFIYFVTFRYFYMFCFDVHTSLLHCIYIHVYSVSLHVKKRVAFLEFVFSINDY